MDPVASRESSQTPKGLSVIGLIVIASLAGSTLYSLNHLHSADKVEYWWDLQYNESGDPTHFGDEWSQLLLSTTIHYLEFENTPSKAGIDFILEKAVENAGEAADIPHAGLKVTFPDEAINGESPVSLALKDVSGWEALRRVAAELNCRVQIEADAHLAFRQIDDREVTHAVAKFVGLPQTVEDGALLFAPEAESESDSPSDLTDKFRDLGIVLSDDDSVIYYPDRDVFVASTSLDQMPAIQLLNQKFICGTCLMGPTSWWETCQWKMMAWAAAVVSKFERTPSPATSTAPVPLPGATPPNPFR